MTCPGCGAPDDQVCRRKCPETRLATPCHEVFLNTIERSTIDDSWLFTDSYGDTYRLRPTHVPHDPIRIIPETRK